jgi:hypothetical protein
MIYYRIKCHDNSQWQGCSEYEDILIFPTPELAYEYIERVQKRRDLGIYEYTVHPVIVDELTESE